MTLLRPVIWTSKNHLPRQLIPWGQIKTMSTLTRQRVFQLKLNPLTGNSEWVVVKEEDDEEEDAKASKHLLALTSYLDMLNDKRRNRAYREAIEKTITKPCNVLDIGAGTGLLSLMASRAMMKGQSATTSVDFPGIVTACESYLPMVKLLKKVVHANKSERNIRIVYKRSDELQVGVDITGRADVLVSEILDSELLGEGLIPTLQHAHDCLLARNAKIVPYRAVTYGQLVESKVLQKMHDLHGHEAQGTDSVQLVPNGFEAILCVERQQHPMHCDAMLDDLKLLSEPFKVFEFDFWKRPDSYGEKEVHIKAINGGRVNAIVSWWVLQLDHQGEISYSTAPKWISSPLSMRTGDFCDHWKQCVWFVPGNGMPLSTGNDVFLHAVHSETKISYELKSLLSDELKHDFISGDFFLSLPPERIAILGDNEWRSSMSTALRNHLAERDPRVCIIADDSLYLTLLVAQISTKTRIIPLFPGLRERGNQYLMKVAEANGLSPERIEVFHNKKHWAMETIDHKVDLLMAEPYYYGTDGMLPWQNLRFWNDRTKLDSLLSDNAIIMPCKAILRGCAMSLPELWSSRCSLSTVEGFDHSAVNKTMGACGNVEEPDEGPILPYFVWQCGHYEKLSHAFTIMEFEISERISPCRNRVQTCFSKNGVCHGFVLWVDWVMDEKQSIVLTTGPDKMFWKQGVKLLSKPVSVGLPESQSGEFQCAAIEASFNPASGDLTIRYILN